MERKHLEEAAARLMSDQHTDPYLAGGRFLDAAELLGLSTSFVWGVLAPQAAGAPAGPRYTQAVMAVPGTGGTAMLFLSPQPHPKGLWRAEVLKRPKERGDETRSAAALHQRVALLRHACAELAAPAAGSITLVQALIEPQGRELIEAYEHAGFTRLGDLAYMRRSLPAKPASAHAGGAAQTPWPAGVRVECVADLRKSGADQSTIDRWLIAALDDTYIDTLDCPELCGLRASRDVLASHRAVGQHDERLWWIVFREQAAHGCVLMNPTRESDAVELVYLGLGPRLRGKGLGRRLMEMALSQVWAITRPQAARAGLAHASLTGGVTCAVDTRNAPALALYDRLGFVRFGVRVPMVRPVGAPARG